jgi:glycosyltransferase involved in cell wall biosynthesis
MKITATIIAFNEESHIQAACESVAWADEIVVVDSESTDATRDLATAAGARVIINPWPGFSAQKQFAVDQSKHDWIFSLDADERVSAALMKSIEELRQRGDSSLAHGYRLPRRTYYQGRWIRGGGWYPDRQLRLFRKSAGHWKQRHIHESVEMVPGARIETLAGDLFHYTARDASYHHKMIGERYAPLAALRMFEQGRRTSPVRIASAAPAAFIRSLILKAGFRDGLAGWSIASFAAHHAFLKHLMLWEMQNKDSQ